MCAVFPCPSEVAKNRITPFLLVDDSVENAVNLIMKYLSALEQDCTQLNDGVNAPYFLTTIMIQCLNKKFHYVYLVFGSVEWMILESSKKLNQWGKTRPTKIDLEILGPSPIIYWGVIQSVLTETRSLIARNFNVEKQELI